MRNIGWEIFREKTGLYSRKKNADYFLKLTKKLIAIVINSCRFAHWRQ